MKRTCTLVAMSGLAGLGWGSDAVFRTVVLSDTPAPGLSNVHFDAVSDPRISPIGHTLFWARLRGESTTALSDTSLWWAGGDTTSLLLREGDPSPTGQGDFLTGIPTAAWDEAGRFALAASFNVPGGGTQTTRLAALRESPTGDLFARFVEAVNVYTLPAIVPLAPLGEGAVWNTASRDNEIAFVSDTGRVYNNTTLVPGAGGGVIPAGAVFRQFSPPGLNRTGRVAFRAAAGLTNATANWNYGLFSDREGVLALLGVVGGQVAGAPMGQVFRELGQNVVMNAEGAVAFWARVEGAGAPAGSDTAIFIDMPETGPRAIVRAGVPAPGTTLAAFSGFSRQIGFSDSGTLAFVGYLIGGGTSPSTNSGVWMWNASLSAPALLAREGGAAPGTPGAVFAGFGDVRVGPAGQIAFLASLAGPGVTQDTSSALFATDRSGVLRQIARVGEGFDIPGLDHRIIRQIIFDHDEAGFSQMNASGEIALKLAFADNTHGLFVATLPCFGDFNGDGGIDAADVDAFLEAWERGDPAADCNLDGSVDGADLEAFFRRWEAGTC